MKSILVVDDEPLARKRLLTLLNDFPEFKVVGEAGRLGDAKRMVVALKPDVILLDVELYGENGFDLLNDLPENVQIIFVTAFNEYAVRAFDVNALDYIMKPVSPDRMRQALQRVVANELAASPGQLTDGPVRCERNDVIYLQHGRKRWFEPIDSLMFLYEDESGSVAVLRGGRRVAMRRTLKEWCHLLSPKLFMRIHAATMIRVDLIECVSVRENGSLAVQLKDVPGTLIVDKDKADCLLSRLDSTVSE